jgi:hypothetical protein
MDDPGRAHAAHEEARPFIASHGHLPQRIDSRPDVGRERVPGSQHRGKRPHLVRAATLSESDPVRAIDGEGPLMRRPFHQRLTHRVRETGGGCLPQLEPDRVGQLDRTGPQASREAEAALVAEVGVQGKAEHGQPGHKRQGEPRAQA